MKALVIGATGATGQALLPLLIRPDSDRPGERISVRILHGLNAIGLLRSQRPLPVADLARALFAAALDPQDGLKTCSPEGIRQLLQENP